MRGEKIEIVCAMDTSGSISHDDLIRYLSEIRGICSIFGDYTIHLFQADTEIHKYDIIEDESEMPKVVSGRGGTSFKAVFNKVEETEELAELPVVYFTDLDGDMPNRYHGDGVFWMIRKEQNRGSGHKVPFGRIIEIDD
jgi:predicted metal-dependent peptidase